MDKKIRIKVNSKARNLKKANCNCNIVITFVFCG